MNARALAGPNPMPSRASWRAAVPTAVPLTPNSTERLETTTSLAEMPARSAAARRQSPEPKGASAGAMARPTTAANDPSTFSPT